MILGAPKRSHARWVIYVSFLAAMVLDILPLPAWINWLRPEWTLLVLIYWTMAMPEAVGIVWACVLGLFLDLLNGTLFGLHAFSMIVVVYIVIKLHKRLRVYPLMQQTAIVFLLLILNNLLLYVLLGIINERLGGWLHWFGLILSTLLWPWIFVVLRDFRRKLNVR